MGRGANNRSNIQSNVALRPRKTKDKIQVLKTKEYDSSKKLLESLGIELIPNEQGFSQADKLLHDSIEWASQPATKNDWVDLKLYEPAMRHLIDTYVRAEDSVKLSAFDDVSLVDLLIEQGAGAVDLLPDGIKKNDGSVAETIDNNVRKAIVKQSSSNPRYYEKMSVLLGELISQRQTDALSYKEYLDQIVELAKDVKDPSNTSAYPDSINSSALQALYDNLNKDEKLALLLDKQIRLTKKDDWRNNRVKEIEVKRAIKECLNGDTVLTDEILELVKNQNDY